MRWRRVVGPSTSQTAIALQLLLMLLLPPAGGHATPSPVAPSSGEGGSREAAATNSTLPSYAVAYFPRTNEQRETPLTRRECSSNVSERTAGALRCLRGPSCEFFSDVLLVVKLNAVRLLWLDALMRFYGTGFPHIVFYATLRKGDTSHDKFLRIGQLDTPVFLLEDNYGFCDHEVVADAMRRWPPRQAQGASGVTCGSAGWDFAGYLYLSDDVLLQYWRLTGLDKRVIWRQPLERPKIPKDAPIEKAVAAISTRWPEVASHFKAHPDLPFASTSGIYYVPGRYSVAFIAMSAVLMAHRTYNEWGTPTLLTAVGRADATVELPGRLVWGARRLKMAKMLFGGKHGAAYSWFHPVRASSELFSRLTVIVYDVKGFPLGLEHPVLAPEDVFTRCFECATYPSSGRRMKALYHSCLLLPKRDERHRCKTSPAATVKQLWPAMAKDAAAIGGNVDVPPHRRDIPGPLEEGHEGFWSADITVRMFSTVYPALNASKQRGTLLQTYPTCCRL